MITSGVAIQKGERAARIWSETLRNESPSVFHFRGSRKVGERGAVLCVEFEAYPEPKVLTGELAAVVASLGGIQRAADQIGASYVFVWQNMARHA